MKLLLKIALIFTSSLAFAQEENFNLKDNNAYQYALIEASRQKMVGNINEAIALYNKCIEFQADCAVAYYELGTIYSAYNDNIKSESYLKKAFELNPDNFWYGIAYSEVLMLNNKDKESLKVLKKINNDSDQNRLTINYKIADVYSELGKYRKAIKNLNEIEEDRGISEMISLRKSETYLKNGKISSAEKELLKLIDRVPDFSGYRLIMAEFYMETKDTTSAIMAYEKAYELDTANIMIVTTLSDLLLKRDQYDKSIYYLEQAFKSDDIDISAKLQALIIVMRNKDLLVKKKDEIEKLLHGLLLKYPESVDLKTVAYDFYNGVGNNIYAFALIKQILNERKDVFVIWQQALYNANMIENYDEMLKLSSEALKYFPNKPEIYLMAGLAYYQKKDYESCFKILKDGIAFVNEKDEFRVQYYILLGESAYYSKRIDESFDYFEELISIDPKNNMVKNNYSYFMAIEGRNLEKAKKLSKETIDSEPDNSTFLDTYGWILFVMGEYKEAKVFIEKALKSVENKDPEILFHYAEILFKLGQTKESINYYIEAGKSGYNEKIIQQKIKNVNFNE